MDNSIVDVSFQIEVNTGGEYSELVTVNACGNEDEILELFIEDETGHEVDPSELHFSILKDIEFRAFNLIQDKLGIVVDIPILSKVVSS